MTISDHVLALGIGGTKLATGAVGSRGEVRSFVRTPGPGRVPLRSVDLLLPVRRAALSHAMRPAGTAARIALSAHGVGVVGAAASAFRHLDDGGPA